MEHKETAKFQVGTDPAVEIDTSGPGWEKFRQIRAERIERDRSARLARIDETARAILAARFVPTGNVAQACATAYRFALALERARDEAVKEIQ